jgi:hypothetical protein
VIYPAYWQIGDLLDAVDRDRDIEFVRLGIARRAGGFVCG